MSEPQSGEEGICIGGLHTSDIGAFVRYVGCPRREGTRLVLYRRTDQINKYIKHNRS